MSEIQSHQLAHPAPAESEDELEKLAAQSSIVNQGREVFGSKCAACHGADLQGIIGPNLTDEYWIHGKGTLTDIALVVRSGVLDKGMPSWKEQLKTDEVQAVVVFVASRRGSHPANPKAPQGDKVGN
jgi:cytochrome c oxidase cbb3-type subunit 3